jgi:hypothetical protein
VYTLATKSFDDLEIVLSRFVKVRFRILDIQITIVCNRTRNEHFACLEQAAKLNFAAVALTTAVKVKVISFQYLFIITITTYLSLYLRCDLTKSGLGTVKV